MNIENEKRKFNKNLNKISNNILNKTSLLEYLQRIENEEYTIWSKNKNIELHVMSDAREKRKRRHEITNTLIQIGYVRTSKEWAPNVTISFLSQMFQFGHMAQVWKKPQQDSFLKTISERYNVPTSRLNTTVSLFLNNYAKGVDKANISEYFTDYEIVMWKYRDKEKLQKDLEAGKVTPKEEAIIHELYNL